MPLILGAQSAAAAVAQGNSCRFNDGDSAYMHKTRSAGDVDKWTFSVWIKRGVLGTAVSLLGSSPTANSNFETIAIAPTANGDVIDWEHYEYTSTSYKGRLKTNRVFRDSSAWYHIVAVWDSDNASAGDRMRLYINGVEETSFATDTQPSSDQDSLINSANPQQVGASGSAANFFDGYMAEVCFIDGTVYAASDFGEYDSDSPTIWKPKDVSGLTFGTQGYYFDFKDSSALGADVSGNGNDFTLSNIDATDQATDTPTNNFSTMNPLDNYYQGATFSEGNNMVLTDTSKQNYNTGTFGMAAGKWYWEMKCEAIGGTGSHVIVGIAEKYVTSTSEQEVGESTYSYGYYSYNGKYQNNGSTYVYGDAWGVGDIIGYALDLTNNKFYFSVDGVWQDSGDPTSGATGTGAISVGAANLTQLGVYLPAISDFGSSHTLTGQMNFGGSPAFTVSSGNADGNGYGNFEYEPPSGYLALCTKNLGSDGG